MFKKILVGLDGSSFSEQIIRYASEEALQHRSEVILLRVLIPPVPTTVTEKGLQEHIPLNVPTPEQMKVEEEEALDYLESLASPMRELEIDVQCIVQWGDPEELIVDFAVENDIELIAITTHGHGLPRSLLRKVVFGAVAEYVLKNSNLPILLVKPTEEGEQ